MHPISNFPEEQKNDYKLNLDIHNIKKAGMILRAFQHKLRQDLIRMIHDHKSITVTQLYTQLEIEQSVASQHLAILRRAGIVTILRQGKHKYYSIDPVRIDEIINFAKNLGA
jgi:DNA-binding transcriptional ArsR family regulator